MTSARGSSPTSRPSRSTSTRVERRMISGSSLEMRRIGVALGGQLVDEGVDLGLGPHVDAARGLVEDEHAAARGQPLGQHHLLLVAAGEARDHRVEAGGLHAQALAVLRGPGPRSASRSTKVRRARRFRMGRVVFSTHGQAENEALLLAVFGHVAEAAREGEPRVAEGQRRAAER